MKKSFPRKYQNQDSAHEPVMVNETMEYLDPQPGKFLVDGTVGGGGHAAAIIKKMAGRGTFLGIDWDGQAIENAKRVFNNAERSGIRLIWVSANYADLLEILAREGLPKPDGILLDLGFSTLQIETSGRGFSFMRDEPLLMTYGENAVPVRDVIRELREDKLAEIIRDFGGERFARRIARAIKERLRKERIETSGEFAEVIRKALPANYERGRIDPATRTFQALRIYANHELDNLEKFLEALPQTLALAGRIVIISFHSLEDRLVKNHFRNLAKEKRLEILTKKPLSAGADEIARNPKSRSAKLRAACAV